MRSTVEIYGLVLAGGKSQRMGSDKGLLNVHGEPLREYMLGQLRRVCKRSYTSCRPEQQVPSWMNPIYDEPFTSGPLNGLLSAFNYNPYCAWLVVAVDMPYVDSSVLQSLVEQRDPAKLATCYMNAEMASPEPLLSIWEPSAFVLLLEFIKKENSSMRHFLFQHPVKMVRPTSVKVLRSLNDPDDIMDLTEVCDGHLKLKRALGI